MATTIRLPENVFDWRRDWPEPEPSEPTLADVRAVVYARANALAAAVKR